MRWLWIVLLTFQFGSSKIQRPLPPLRAASLSPMPHSNNVSMRQSLIAGGLSRVIAQTALHPLDTMRTQAQLRVRVSDKDFQISPANLLRGILPQIFFSGPAGAVQFSVLEVDCLLLHSPNCLLEIKAIFICLWSSLSSDKSLGSDVRLFCRHSHSNPSRGDQSCLSIFAISSCS
jgi:hypothetical protein